MKPVVKALNILQSETNTHMGWLLPVIFQLQAKLSRLETSSKMCLPLIREVQDGVQKRFGEMMHNPELIAAAILLLNRSGLYKMDLLNSFPHIRNLSLKLNTGLPASAACERLFSSAGLLFTAKRARMNSANFENKLLLKLNRKFIE
ncbi:hypothetical protein QQF64_023908 [Cirrhinus molitorella]|uniref:HAT C-terminal dimerisation domain-containing protein n=1 Tax=Cirrhinus molitorella TaxID=172907 RepID=A0ABR3NJX2_9TELE